MRQLSRAPDSAEAETRIETLGSLLRTLGASACIRDYVMAHCLVLYAHERRKKNEREFAGCNPLTHRGVPRILEDRVERFRGLGRDVQRQQRHDDPCIEMAQQVGLDVEQISLALRMPVNPETRPQKPR